MSRLTRRNFIKVTSVASTGLLLGISLQGCSDDTPDSAEGLSEKTFHPNAWLKLTADSKVTIIIAESEMGQGVMTSLPMLIAEELEIGIGDITIERAPVGPEYGYQVTSGSTSIRQAWQPLRMAGAIARDMLIAAAAQTWNVAETDCKAENGQVKHQASGKILSYGDLVPVAVNLPVPETAILKSPDAFKLIGKSTPLTNDADMVTGKTIFGIDVSIPDLLIASIVHCPVFGGKLSELDDSDAMKIPGILHIVPIDSGVAVVAKDYWTAHKGALALNIRWNTNQNEDVSDKSILERYKSHTPEEHEVITRTGNPDTILQQANTILEATYIAPFQAHATMEPMNCTAWVQNGECDIWAPTQSPDSAQYIASTYILSTTDKLISKIKRRLSDDYSLDTIRVHTTNLGGGFGRRLKQDFVAEAVQISQAIRKPVKLIWSREEDIQHDYYRPLTLHRMTAALDKKNNITAWKQHIVGPSKGKSTDGAVNLIYATASRLLGYAEDKYPVPIGSWRSVGASHNGFIIESFIDELAHEAGDDPYQFRSRLLQHSPRNLAVLSLAAEKSDWGKPQSENMGRGIAVFEAYGTHVAQVAEVTVRPNGTVQVHRVVCVVDCGIAVNPDTIRAQIEGAIVFGLTATLKSEINIENGKTKQSNFHDFQILRFEEMPVIETHIVPSTEAPGGIGESGVPPVTAAVANAIYAATGIRIRKLPVSPGELSSR